MARPKFIMGKQNIRSTDFTSAAQAGRAFAASVSDILGNFQRFVEHVEGATPEAIRDTLQPTFDKSQEYCPVADGTLKESGFLEVESFRGGSRAVMGYGRGGKPDYAIYVHEMPYKHAEPTRSKFLQAAVEEDYFGIIDRLPQNIKKASGV